MMRLVEKRIIDVEEPYSQEEWLSIWKPHLYHHFGSSDFCYLCKHSASWHFENKEWCEPKYET